MKKPVVLRRVKKLRHVPTKKKKSRAESIQQWTAIGASTTAILAALVAAGLYIKDYYVVQQAQLDAELAGFWTTNTEFCVDCPDSIEQTINIDLEVSKGDVTGRIDVGCMFDAPEHLWEGKKLMSDLNDDEKAGLLNQVKKLIYTHLEVLGNRSWFSDNAHLYITLVKAKERFLIAEASFKQVDTGYELRILSGDLHLPDSKIFLFKRGEPFVDSSLRACRD